jgi:DNA-binding CsgD family transcriptional regulator
LSSERPISHALSCGMSFHRVVTRIRERERERESDVLGSSGGRTEERRERTAARTPGTSCRNVLRQGSRRCRSRAVSRLSECPCVPVHLLFTAMALGQSDDPAVELSSREKDCLRWLVQGKSSWDIGAFLGISENTVAFHVKKAMRKLKTTSRTAAVVNAIHLGLIALPDGMLATNPVR